MAPQFTSIDLFAGIGGFRLAVERCGGHCVAFSEIAPDAIATYMANHGVAPSENLGDITKLKELPTHDFLTGGVPCQSWSIAGRNLGFDDDRGQLWNDALFLLNQSRPKAFLFENVKGLSDPRNAKALQYILGRISEAGYSAVYRVINSFDFGVPQSRERIYIVGFRERHFLDRFSWPIFFGRKTRLGDILDEPVIGDGLLMADENQDTDLFGDAIAKGNAGGTSLSSNNNGFCDYFLLNDIRNGHTTIHSWEILDTSERERQICLLLLSARRKKDFGNLDGNPLSLSQFQQLDSSILQVEIDALCAKGILKPEVYRYSVISAQKGGGCDLSEAERIVLSLARNGEIVPDDIWGDKELRKTKVKAAKCCADLAERGILAPVETRYDFRYTKISTGLFGVSRIFLPTSDIFPTLVASDSSDYVTPVSIFAADGATYKRRFLEEVYLPGRYRKITKTEACRIQGFPDNFRLPESRARWMKLVGNSVSVPVIESIIREICATGVFHAQPPKIGEGNHFQMFNGVSL